MFLLKKNNSMKIYTFSFHRLINIGILNKPAESKVLYHEKFQNQSYNYGHIMKISYFFYCVLVREIFFFFIKILMREPSHRVYYVGVLFL